MIQKLHIGEVLTFYFKISVYFCYWESNYYSALL